MGRKRERLDIIIDVLVAIRDRGGRIKPTHLMYKANLAHRQMKSYLEELVKKNLVSTVREAGYEYVAITDEGLRFVERVSQLREFERAFGL